MKTQHNRRGSLHRLARCKGYFLVIFGVVYLSLARKSMIMEPFTLAEFIGVFAPPVVFGVYVIWALWPSSVTLKSASNAGFSYEKKNP